MYICVYMEDWLEVTGVVDEVMGFESIVAGEEATAAITPDADAGGSPGGNGRRGGATIAGGAS